MIHVIATVEIAPGKREAFLQEFHRVVPLVQGENGCLEYGPALDIPSGLPVQTALRDNVVTIIEKWAGLDELRVHLAAPHMKEYRERVKDLVVRVSLQVLQPA